MNKNRFTRVRKNLEFLNIGEQLSSTTLMCLSIFYAATQILAIVIVGRLISTPFGPISAGSVVAPFWFLFNDMIAELFGYRVSRMVFWSAMFAELFFSLLAVIIIHLPSPKSTFSSSAYMLVFGHLPLIYCAQLIAIIFGWYINTRILLRWKLLLHGRLFWLRSTASSAIGEIIFSVIAASIIMTRLSQTWKTHADPGFIVHLVAWSVLLKIIGSIVFTIPAAIIVSLLKKAGAEKEALKKLSPFCLNNQLKDN